MPWNGQNVSAGIIGIITGAAGVTAATATGITNPNGITINGHTEPVTITGETTTVTHQTDDETPTIPTADPTAKTAETHAKTQLATSGITAENTPPHAAIVQVIVITVNPPDGWSAKEAAIETAIEVVIEVVKEAATEATVAADTGKIIVTLKKVKVIQKELFRDIVLKETEG